MAVCVHPHACAGVRIMHCAFSEAVSDSSISLGGTLFFSRALPGDAHMQLEPDPVIAMLEAEQMQGATTGAAHTLKTRGIFVTDRRAKMLATTIQAMRV